MLKNAIAAAIALVLDELEAELILTQHIQDVLYFETDAFGDFSQESSIAASLVRVSMSSHSEEAFYKGLD